MASKEQKLIIIGSKGYQRNKEGIRIDCYEWKEIKNVQNIRDYDTVILSLLKLKSGEEIKNVDWQKFREILDFRSAVDILSYGGAIIVVGDPRFTIMNEVGKSAYENVVKGKIVHFTEWTGIDFRWDPAPGDTKIFEDASSQKIYSKYVNHLMKWNYSLEYFGLNWDTLRSYFNLDFLKKERIEVVIDRDFFCRNRYGNALAFRLRYELVEIGEYGGRNVIRRYGPLIFLPAISLGEDETLQIVLKDICGVETGLPEPDWLKNYLAPDQNQIDEKINKIMDEFDSVLDRLREAENDKKEIRKCLALLYEREHALEPVVRDILRRLGAKVEEPTEPNKEDGWISVWVNGDEHEGVLEIKSTKSNQFNEEGRKQLLDWIDRGSAQRGKNYKGIFIGNSAVNISPNQRPLAFSSSWVRAAKRSSICVMKTEDLYAIYLLSCEGKIDINLFWKGLFETKGVFSMKEYSQLLEKHNFDLIYGKDFG